MRSLALDRKFPRLPEAAVPVVGYWAGLGVDRAMQGRLVVVGRQCPADAVVRAAGADGDLIVRGAALD